MAQYCRYCTYMVCGDANYCHIRNVTYSDEYIKRPNKCRSFELNPIDALFENTKGYKPRKPKADDGEQLTVCDDWVWELENAEPTGGLISRAKLFNRIATECHYDTEHPLESYAKLIEVINSIETED